VFAPQNILLYLPWMSLGMKLGLVDNTSRLFLLFTALLWWLSGVYARAYLSNQPDRGRFFGFFLLSMAGNLGLILAQELMSFYIFFALMSFSSYGLVIHERSIEALRAGRIYIILVVIGEVALFAALVMATIATGSTEFDIVRLGFAQAESRSLIMFLALIGFGIKAGVLGLHVWLPLAHPVAPTPASAVLSGAMIKAGLLGWLRLLPIGEMVMLQWGEIFMFLGLAAAFYGVIVGLTQKVPKTLLAYSSISQMGIMTMAVGLGLTATAAHDEILAVITLFALHHGLSKGALFLGVGVIGACKGLQRRWVWLALWLPALALAGAPLTSGMAVKALLKAQMVNAPGVWEFGLKILLPCSSVATTLLVGRFLVLLFRPNTETAEHQPIAGLVWPWGLLVAASVILPWWYVPEPSQLWSQNTIIGSLWPVLFGIVVIAAVIVWTAFRTRHPGVVSTDLAAGNSLLRIPPGDLLVLINRFFMPIFTYCRHLFVRKLPCWRDTLLTSIDSGWQIMNFMNFIGRAEQKLNRWPSALVILLLVGLVMIVLGVSPTNP
jgi:formate hydrogenlyase subunit 3/multisubunit Na+/H+ antiporter MnhD subunit